MHKRVLVGEENENEKGGLGIVWVGNREQGFWLLRPTTGVPNYNQNKRGKNRGEINISSMGCGGSYLRRKEV